MKTPKDTRTEASGRSLNEVLREWFTTSDEREFHDLTNQLYGRLVRTVARKLGVSDPDIEDLAQEVMMAATNLRKQCEPPDNLLGWLYGTINKKCATHLRGKTRRMDSMEGKDDPPDRMRIDTDCPGIDLDVGTASLIAMIIDQQATPAARAVMGICLAFVQAEPERRITEAQIAAMAGCSVGAVKQRFREIRQRSRKRFDETVKKLQRKRE